MGQTSSAAVRFLYGTAVGRTLLKGVRKFGLDRVAVRFLCSPLSKHIIPSYIRKNQIPMDLYEAGPYPTFRDFFLREKKERLVDLEPTHLVSPCDGWLSVYPIEANSSFAIKGSRYRLCDLLLDPVLGKRYHGGTCLVFRLCASDYHHYCYMDDGRLERTCYIEGELHSVQPIACETYPVFTLNRRAWSLLETEHFGPVIQTEIGALVVGGIVNEARTTPFRRGEEKGRFELSGSTIVLLLEQGRAQLLPWVLEAAANGEEARVTLGQWIGTQIKPGAPGAYAKEQTTCAGKNS